MKIAMVCNPHVSVPPKRYGGIEQIVHVLCEGLTDKGHEVHLYATGDSKISGFLRYIYQESTWPPDVHREINHYSFAFSDIVREGDFDLVHLHGANALPFTRFLPNIPCIYTLHHVKNETLSSLYTHFPDVHYISISEYQKSQEIPLANVRTIYHGLDISHFSSSSKPEAYVTFLGRITKVKGLHTAIRAAAMAGVPLRIGGPVHWVDEPYFKEEIKPLMRLGDVTHLGDLNFKEKTSLLRKAKATLFPIEWDEPFGLVMIESMLCGTPVIAFPKGSVSEIVEEGVTGFVVRNLKEMAELIKGPKLTDFDRVRCAERARERFNATRFIDEHEVLYQEVHKSFRACLKPQLALL
jgi:glycosyltransferase involved in cell wall biosynthesis